MLSSHKNTLRVLLLEDTYQDAELIINELENAAKGVIYQQVVDEAGFIKALSSFSPDIILSDYNLPSYDGYQALLKAKEILPDIPFILVTGALGDEKAVACIKAGADDYVLKNHLSRLTPAIKNTLDKKNAQRALRESEARLFNIAQTVPCGITILNTEGQITYVNPAAVQILGFTSDSIVHKNFNDFDWDITANDGSSLSQELLPFSIVMKTSLPVYGNEHTIRKPDGTRVFLAINAAPLFNASSEIQGVITSFTDITERRKGEQLLLEYQHQLKALNARLLEIREEERTAIAREIHDELGQSLTAMKIDLSWLQGKFPQNSDLLQERTEEMIQLTDAIISTVQRISSDLRPGLLDDLGLAAAIEWQAKEYSDRFGIPCFIERLDEIENLNKAQSTSLFRIFQETMTNVARHSSATKVVVNLLLEKSSIILQIHDNGKGITDDQIYAPASIGILGMKERAEAHGGIFFIEGSPETGTTVKVIFDNKAVNSN